MPDTKMHMTQEIPAMIDGNRQLINLADALAPYIVASFRAELVRNPIAHICNFQPGEVAALKANIRYGRIAIGALIVMAISVIASLLMAGAVYLKTRNGA